MKSVDESPTFCKKADLEWSLFWDLTSYFFYVLQIYDLSFSLMFVETCLGQYCSTTLERCLKCSGKWMYVLVMEINAMPARRMGLSRPQCHFLLCYSCCYYAMAYCSRDTLTVYSNLGAVLHSTKNGTV